MNWDDGRNYAAWLSAETETVPAGSLPANPWVLHEVHGNVWESAQDCYKDTYEGAPRDGSAVEVTNCEARVLRGGCWGTFPVWLRSALRAGDTPTFRTGGVGFRLARTL